MAEKDEITDDMAGITARRTESPATRENAIANSGRSFLSTNRMMLAVIPKTTIWNISNYIHLMEVEKWI